MKIFILFMCLLGVTYTEENEKPKGLSEVCRYLRECSIKHSKYPNSMISMIDIATWNCTLEKQGVITNGIISTENATRNCDYIMAENNVPNCKEKVYKCIEDDCSKLGCNNTNLGTIVCVITCVIRSGVTQDIDCTC